MNANEIVDGLPVIFWFVIDEHGYKYDPFLTSIRSPVWTVSGNQQIVKVKGFAGGVAIEHLDPVNFDTVTLATMQGFKTLPVDGSDFGGKLSFNPSVTVEQAVNTLRLGLKKDTDLYYTYQANIAVAIVEEWRKEYSSCAEMLGKTQMGETQISEIANAGAVRFLNLLIDSSNDKTENTRTTVAGNQNSA